MKTYDDNFDMELEERDVMCFFNCDRELAKKIIESSQANGQIESIKQKCMREKENNNG